MKMAFYTSRNICYTIYINKRGFVMKIYLVGGAVRDEILGIPSNDKDYVVVGSSPEEMKSFGFEQVGKDFPVFLHPETKDEYALARTERKSGQKHTDFEFDWGSSITLEDDLLRRDLTINAIAKSKDGDYIDPYGGIKDIENKILRHVSDSFKDDPLRILRVARFAAKNPDFKIAEETKEFMVNMVKNGELNHLTPERVWKEMEKALVSEEPANFIDALDQVGALEIVLPEIKAMQGVPQRSDYHAEGDVYIHNQMVLREATKLTQSMDKDEKGLIRFAALCHDFGKTKTPEDYLYNEDGTVKGSHFGHEKRELVEPMLNKFCERLKIPNKYKKIALDVAVHHQRLHGIKNSTAKKITKMLNEISPSQKADKRGGDHYLNMMIIACEADAYGRFNMGPDKKISKPPREYPQGDILRESYKAYQNIKESLSDWMRTYEERNEKKPDGELIKLKVHEARVSSIKNKMKNF